MINFNAIVLTFFLLYGQMFIGHAQSKKVLNKLNDANLNAVFCSTDGAKHFTVNEVQSYVLENIGVSENEYIEQILICTSQGNMLSVSYPSNNPIIKPNANLILPTYLI
ncbi:hypothetical protein PK35_15040 [Tamlana nanhaiensis]|uniref:Uncharacterized protein n=1 Tax=Neotamlana nanhaiensis TaxID=1382798 RepID=A0A0D7VX17_9FLAO|nr:hypothetical protein [Tamlana nanhaiensis]KJD31420.1 hypothetical protein PK35_15040 [Tamlana nanhaiensis]